MMEKYWEIVSVIAVVIGQIVKAGIIGHFFKPFMKEGKKVVGIACSYVTIMLILYFVPYEVNAAVAYGIGVIVLFLSGMMIEKDSAYKKLFLSVTSYLLLWIARGVSIIPWNGLYQITVLNPRVEASQNLQFGFFVFAEFMGVVLEGAILLLLVILFHKVYMRKKEDMSRREVIMLLSPYLSIVAGYWLVSFMKDAYFSDTGIYIWNKHSWYEWMTAVFQIISFLTILAMVTCYERIRSSREEELQRVLLAEQVSELKSHISQVENLYSGIRGMKHDLNNHIQILNDLYESGAYSEAKDYLMDMKKNYSETTLDIKTGNPITDIVIMQKLKEAEMKGVSMTQSFCFPDHGNASAYDISIVLNNVLANAIEAAYVSGEKYVNIKSWMKNDIYFVEVNNSFDEKLVLDEEGGLPETTKSKENGHGFGLLNVKKTVEKYYGGVDIEQVGNMVKLSVMMVIPS